MIGTSKFLGCLLVAVLASSTPVRRLGAQEAAEPVLVADPSPLPLSKEAAPDNEQKSERQEEPWLGIGVTKPSQSIHAQLVGVPKGVGFTVQNVTVGSPAELAGLQQNDFLWKLDDQLLINESQMFVLLNLHKVGETVKLTFQRSDKDHEIEAVLVGRPESEKGRNEADLVVLSPPVPGLPIQIVNLGRRVAEIRDGEGLVKIERAGEQFGWEQRALDGSLIQQGQIPGADEIPEEFDPVLAGKLRALVRTFEHAEDRAASGRRMRRVPRVGVEDEARP